jgi:hypothetical protein
MSLNLEQATGLNHVHAVATAGAALTGLSGAATTYSFSIFGYTINGIAYRQAIASGAATPTTDASAGTAAALALAINQSRVYVWGVNAAGTVQVFAGPAVTWPNSSGTATGAPIPLQFPAVPSTTACIAYVVISNGSNGAAFAHGTTNWNATGITVGTVVNLAGWLPALLPTTP